MAGALRVVRVGGITEERKPSRSFYNFCMGIRTVESEFVDVPVVDLAIKAPSTVLVDHGWQWLDNVTHVGA